MRGHYERGERVQHKSNEGNMIAFFRMVASTSRERRGGSKQRMAIIAPVTVLVAVFLAMTMVDFSEQLYSWQDQVCNSDGKPWYATLRWRSQLCYSDANNIEICNCKGFGKQRKGKESKSKERKGRI
eukprot:scaffold102411_cov18-Tisochrysis_lutea.AAC.3